MRSREEFLAPFGVRRLESMTAPGLAEHPGRMLIPLARIQLAKQG